MFTLFLLLSQILTTNPRRKAQRVCRVACSALLHSFVVHLQHVRWALSWRQKLSAGPKTGVALAATVKTLHCLVQWSCNCLFRPFGELRGRHAAGYRLEP